MFTDFKNSFTSIKRHICNEVTHHDLNAWLFNLLFIINHTTYFRLPPVFWHSYISQGSVATYVMGYLNISLLQIYQWVCDWKNFENRLIFREVMGKSLVSCFFDSRCSNVIAATVLACRVGQNCTLMRKLNTLSVNATARDKIKQILSKCSQSFWK